MKKINNCEDCKKILRITLIIIVTLIFINLILITKLDSFKKEGKRFTFEDGTALYQICSKNGGKKEAIIYRNYGKKETDFKHFLLAK